jgi:hypothetical protein
MNAPCPVEHDPGRDSLKTFATPATAAAGAGACTSKPSPARPSGRASTARRGSSGAPERIRAAHLPNQIPQVPPNRGPTPSASTLPRPIASKPVPVPADHGFRPHQLQRMPPARPQPRKENPEDPVRLRQPRPRSACLPHGELLPKRKVLERQLTVRAKTASQCPEEDSEPSGP